MIQFLVCRGYGFTLRPLQKDAKAPKTVIVPYDKALRETELPRATYVFTDLERLSNSDRVAAGHLFRKLAAGGCRVLNDPNRVQARLPLLRTLYRNGLNCFNVHSLQDDVDEPIRFPVFLRVADDHKGPLTDLIPDEDTLERAIEALVEIGYPRNTLIAVEYAAQPIGPGLFRKLSIFRVGDRFVPHPCVHDVGWTIKQGRTGVATTELYDEELEIVRTNPFAEDMKAVFEVAGTDFGRVDFSLVDGRPCIYEINTNPTLASPSPHPVPQRVKSRELWWDGFLSALREIDEPDENGPHLNVSRDNAAILGRALENYPGLRDGFLKLSEALTRCGDREAAMRNAYLALAQGPKDPNLAIRVSRLAADNERLDEAIDIVGQALKANPEDFELVLHASKLLTRVSRNKEAMDAADQAVSLRPDDARGYEALYGMQWALGNMAAALETAKTAIRLVGDIRGATAAGRLKKLRAHQRALRHALVRQRVRSFLGQGVRR